MAGVGGGDVFLCGLVLVWAIGVSVCARVASQPPRRVNNARNFMFLRVRAREPGRTFAPKMVLSS